MSTFHVVAVKSDGKALLVMRRRGQSPRGLSFTVWQTMASPKERDGDLDARQAAAAVKWVKGKGWKPRLVKHGFPFVMKGDDGVVLPGDKELLAKLNRIGRKLRRLIVVKSGYRNNRQQWELRQLFLKGRGNLAARCCLKYNMEQHSWEDCGKQSQSNHSYPPKGRAVDCGVLMSYGYVSIGNVDKARQLMREAGLCLPVPNEPWHVQTFGGWAA